MNAAISFHSFAEATTFDSVSIKEGKKFPAQGITAQASVD